MKQYKIGVFFEKGYLISSQINLVTEDYKSTEFIFEFDIEEGRKVFELKKPDGSKYIKDIINNKITLVDYDTELNEISLIPTAGTYEFEIVNYTEDSKLTLQEHGHFEVRGEIVEVNDSEVEKDTRLPILDSLINDVEGLKTDINSSVKNSTEQANYAKQQGDYAKEQARIIIDANTTATKIINDFETNVSWYTKDFNTNAEEKLEAYNQNDIDKTKTYNKNAESKVNSYNENASNKLKEYNDNATTKLSEYNSNSETKTKAFNTNASEKTDAFNLNATNKTTDFNSNAETKTTEFNDNATTKTEEYNANAEAKVNEFNATVDELKQDVEDCYNNMLTNEAEGTSIHVEDSANARILSLESEGNCEQVSTTGTSLLDFANPYTIINSELSFENDVLTLTTATTKTYDGVRYNILDLIKANVGKTLRLDFESISETNTLSGTAIDSLALAVNGTNVYHTFIGNSSANYVPAIAYYTIPEDVSGITSAVLNIFTNNSSSRPDVSNKVVIKKPILHFGKEKVDYEPYTGGQPSPSPDWPRDVEVIEPYNLFDKDNVNVLNAVLDTSNGKINANTNTRTLYLEIPDNADNITVSRISGERFSVGTIDVLPSIGATCLNYVGNNSAKSITIPVLANSKYVVVYYYNETIDTLSEQEILDGIQIVKGPEVKPHTPHGCIKNKFIGKNLFDYTDGFNSSIAGLTNTINNDGSITVSGVPEGNWAQIVQRKNINHLLEDGQKYTISQSERNSPYLVFIELLLKDKVTGNSTSYKGNATITVDLDKYDYYIGLYASLTTTWGTVSRTITGFYELKKGEVAAEFEPYQENTVDINLQGNFIGKIGDIADTLRVENGRAILTKRIGKVIIDGSENWSYDQAYAIFSSNVLIGAKDDKEVINTLSDRFVSVSYNNRGGDFARIYANNSWVAIRGVKQTTVDEFKIWLQANPTTVYYVLTEPYEVDLGEVTMPKTYEGVTNISMIANLESNMKLKYVRSTNIVVDNLAKAIVAMGGEINV